MAENNNDNDTSTTEVVKNVAKVAVAVGGLLVGLAEAVIKGMEIIGGDDED